MSLTKLNITQFKNYHQSSIEFITQVNCFIGNNGEGKTNLLDAIYYACIGKSYFNSTEKHNILHGQRFFRIEADFNSTIIEAVYQVNSTKSIKKNKVEYEKLADHMGFAPVTFIAPDDNQIILGASDTRRRLMNATISQMNIEYVKTLMQYRKLLKQRNALLKSGQVSELLIQTYDTQIVPLAESIYETRKQYATPYQTLVQKIYAEISQEKEQVDCVYQSQLSTGNYADQLLQNRDKDIILKRTTTGIHRDNLEFLINGHPLKKYGSQGQQKSFLLALKLAEFNFIKQTTKREPILLLDDIFDKLDRNRIYQLFQYILAQNVQQIFMTDTNSERLSEILNKFDNEFTIFIVQNNEIKKQ